MADVSPITIAVATVQGWPDIRANLSSYTSGGWRQPDGALSLTTTSGSSTISHSGLSEPCASTSMLAARWRVFGGSTWTRAR